MQQPPNQTKRTALACEEGCSINAACMWDEGWDVKMTIDAHRREIRGSGRGDRWPTGIGAVDAHRREIRGSGGRGD